MTNVYHEEEGVVFKKIQSDSGISYLSIPLEEVDDANGLLVRHGNPSSGHCGYYPVPLLFVDRTVRKTVAAKLSRRPPNEFWVGRVRQFLESQGLQPIH